MNQDSEKWLDDRISEDVIRMAEKQREQLMESEELKDIDVSADSLEKLKKRLAEMHAEESKDTEAATEFEPEIISVEKKNDGTEGPSEKVVVVHRPRIRLRTALAAALVAVLVLGLGMVGSGKKVYLPVVSQREDGDEKTTLVDNAENVESGYDEEEVCQEIEDKLGVLPVRFGYKPKGMELSKVWIDEDAGEVLETYTYKNNDFHVYISKDINSSSVYFKIDGEVVDNVLADSLGIDLSIYKYVDSDKKLYYQTSFEYLNTYYSFDAMTSLEDFIKILENIIIKNA